MPVNEHFHVDWVVDVIFVSVVIAFIIEIKVNSLCKILIDVNIDNYLVQIHYTVKICVFSQ